MTWNRYRCVAVMACLLPLVLADCVTRKETITIAADRTVTIELAYEGGPAEIAGPDAMPSTESGWDVVRTVKMEDEDEVHTLTAKRVFAPDAELPSSFAPTDLHERSDPQPGFARAGASTDSDADLVLNFPTELWTERRGDMLFYHFRRVYTPRRWAYVHYWEKLHDEAIEDLAGKPVEDMTQEERIRIAKAIAGVEACRRVEFAREAREALEEAQPNIGPDRFLHARRAILDFYEAIDWDDLINRYMEVPEPDRDAFVDRAMKERWDDARQAWVDAFPTDAAWDDDHVSPFERAFDRAKRYYDITKSLGDHQFEIHVKMPGQVVAHNADKQEDDGAVVWEFEGDAFRDRPVELLVTSRVPAESAPNE